MTVMRGGVDPANTRRASPQKTYRSPQLLYIDSFKRGFEYNMQRFQDKKRWTRDDLSSSSSWWKVNQEMIDNQMMISIRYNDDDTQKAISGADVDRVLFVVDIWDSSKQSYFKRDLIVFLHGRQRTNDRTMQTITGSMLRAMGMDEHKYDVTVAIVDHTPGNEIPGPTHRRSFTKQELDMSVFAFVELCYHTCKGLHNCVLVIEPRTIHACCLERTDDNLSVHSADWASPILIPEKSPFPWQA